MKANELTYGDWVLIDGVARKVCAITKHKIGYHLCDGESTMHYARLHDVNSIPLTPEILEKNGLDKVPELSMVINRDTMPLYHSPMLHYVHELQRALRLCGLNDLADGFKI